MVVAGTPMAHCGMEMPSTAQSTVHGLADVLTLRSTTYHWPGTISGPVKATQFASRRPVAAALWKSRTCVVPFHADRISVSPAPVEESKLTAKRATPTFEFTVSAM